MALWQNGDVIKFVTRLRSASGEDIQNVFHYKLDLDQPVTDTVVIPTFLDRLDLMYDKIQPDIPGDVTFVDIDVENITQDIVYGAQAWPNQTTGGGTGDTMPEQLCGLVVGRTNSPHAVGRKFLGPFIEAANLDGVWYSTLLGFLTDFAALYDTPIDLGASKVAVPGIPKWINQVLTAFNFFYETYTSNGIYTQRRRRRGVGA